MNNFDLKAFRVEFLAVLKGEAIARERAKRGPRGHRPPNADSRRDSQAYRDAWREYCEGE